jgi:anti-anti-sigma factor
MGPPRSGVTGRNGLGRARAGFVTGFDRAPKGSGMEIDRSDDDGVTVITVRGVINFGESARQFSSYLQELLKSGVPAVLVDMSGIDNVDSTGLGELVGYLQRFEKEGRRMALLRPHRRIMSLLRLTRLDEIFPVYEDREEAIAELSR